MRKTYNSAVLIPPGPDPGMGDAPVWPGKSNMDNKTILPESAFTGVKTQTPSILPESAFIGVKAAQPDTSSPSLLHPMGWLAAHIPTGQNIENLAKDTASAGTGIQNIIKFLGKSFGSEGPRASSEIAQGINPNAAAMQNPIAQKVASAIDPILNYDIPYGLNSPTSGGNQLLQGIAAGAPLWATGPEGVLANAAYSGIGNAAINNSSTPGQAAKNTALGAGLSLLTHGLIKGAQLGGKYNFIKTGQPVDQLKNDIQLNNQNKQDNLQSLEAAQKPVDTSGSEGIAAQNVADLESQYQTKKAAITGPMPDIQSSISRVNTFGKSAEAKSYKAASQNDDLPVPEEVSSKLLQPQNYQNLDVFDNVPGVSGRDAIAALPTPLQNSIENKFSSKPVKSDLNLSDFVPGAKKIPFEELPPTSQESIRTSFPELFSQPIDKQNLGIRDVVDSFENPKEKAIAIQTLHQKGLLKLNSGRLFDSLLPDDIRDVLNTPAALVRTQKSDFEKRDATLKDVKDYAKAAKSAASSVAEKNSYKRTQLTNLARAIEKNIYEPSLAHYDNKLKTNTLLQYQAAKHITHTITGPAKATSDSRKLVNGSLKNPSAQRITDIIEKAEEKLNNFKNKESGANSTELPPDHFLKHFLAGLKDVIPYESKSIKPIIDAKVPYSPQDQVSAFERAIKSGELPLDHDIVKKNYLPLRDQLSAEEQAKISKEKNYRQAKMKIISNALSKKKSLNSDLIEAKKQQKMLIENPGLIKNALMNHAKLLQKISPLLKVAAPVGFGLMNQPK